MWKEIDNPERERGIVDPKGKRERKRSMHVLRL